MCEPSFAERGSEWALGKQANRNSNGDMPVWCVSSTCCTYTERTFEKFHRTFAFVIDTARLRNAMQLVTVGNIGGLEGDPDLEILRSTSPDGNEDPRIHLPGSGSFHISFQGREGRGCSQKSSNVLDPPNPHSSFFGIGLPVLL
jgi:hypothetical protein